MGINMDHEFKIKLLTNDYWTLNDFDKFIHSVNNIYYTLYICDDIIYQLKNNHENFEILSPLIKKNWISKCIKNKLFPMNIDQALFIKSIHMGSPGEINLRGVGKILHELRELIKDVKYRNEQEYEMGQLNILEKKLEIMRKYGISKNDLEKILLSTNDDCLALIDLEEKGFLGNIVDFWA